MAIFGAAILGGVLLLRPARSDTLAPLDITLNNQLFPPGTSVSAYLTSGWPVQSLPPAGAPKGSAKDTAVVASNGDIAFTGLAAETNYFAAAEVGGVWRYVSFKTATAPLTASAVNNKLVEVEEALEAAEAALGVHAAKEAAVHGITKASDLVTTSDARLSDTRTPKAHTHAISDVVDLAAGLAGAVSKPAEPPAYTQTYATAARVHAAAALPTEIAATLVTEVVTQLNSTNAAVNELKKLVNGLIDDAQARGLAA